ncbi:hypothetical protein ACKWTF_000732 [Chironomus riparius]
MFFDWPFYVFTGVFAFLGIIVPIFTPKGPNRGIIRCCLILSSICCWLFWLCCYLAQIGPLIGPKLHRSTMLIMAREWGNNLNATT